MEVEGEFDGIPELFADGAAAAPRGDADDDYAGMPELLADNEDPNNQHDEPDDVDVDPEEDDYDQIQFIESDDEGDDRHDEQQAVVEAASVGKKRAQPDNGNHSSESGLAVSLVFFFSIAGWTHFCFTLFCSSSQESKGGTGVAAGQGSAAD